jgi:16S rRNA (guanine527-N7)-methyltransferase
LDIIHKYFPQLTKQQFEHFVQLKELYFDWNQKINVISRKDMDNFYERHVLHSLSIANIFSFSASDIILDIGTGGGFPGIPLAILFSDTEFHLIDSIGKKITVVDAVAKSLKLGNIITQCARAENYKLDYTYIVTRAVAPSEKLIDWAGRRLKNSNGIIALKGGDLKDELDAIDINYKTYDLSSYFEESFFDTKKIVHLYY